MAGLCRDTVGLHAFGKSQEEKSENLDTLEMWNKTTK